MVNINADYMFGAITLLDDNYERKHDDMNIIYSRGGHIGISTSFVVQKLAVCKNCNTLAIAKQWFSVYIGGDAQTIIL